MAKTSRKKTLMIANIIVIAGLLGASGYLFQQNRDLKISGVANSEEKVKKENDKIIAEVSKLMQLPASEPTIVLVNNPDEIKSSDGDLEKVVVSLFDDLQKGDYVIFYLKDRQAVQYRQNEKKIIKTTVVALPIVVEIFGSEKATQEMETKLKQLYQSGIVVTKKTLNGISQGFVFDNSTKLKTEAETLAKGVELTMATTLPEAVKPASQTEIVIAVPDVTTPAPAQTPAP